MDDTNMQKTAVAAGLQPQKFSRYRSVRNASQKQDPAINTASVGKSDREVKLDPVAEALAKLEGKKVSQAPTKPAAEMNKPNASAALTASVLSKLELGSNSERNSGTCQRDPIKQNYFEPYHHHPQSKPVKPEMEKPAFDAPVSGLNTVRIVRVKWESSRTAVRVESDTTADEVLRRATEALLPEKDQHSATMLLESFELIGLERPLRQYERVRDILNSWNKDNENTLIVKASPGPSSDLSVEQAPLEPPYITIMSIFISSQPGVWNERNLTLRPDGQMVTFKDEKFKGPKNICHLTDFDIYVPTSRQMKKLEAPRKCVFAIKSQEKTTFFENTATFVHFFATDDYSLATKFYAAVQGWRSWYLVHQLGLGKAKAQTALLQKTAGWPAKGQVQHETTSHGSLSVDQARSRYKTALRQQHPIADAYHQPSPADEQQPFAPTSLLGRTYTQRREEARSKQNSAPTPTLNTQHPTPRDPLAATNYTYSPISAQNSTRHTKQKSPSLHEYHHSTNPSRYKDAPHLGGTRRRGQTASGTIPSQPLVSQAANRTSTFVHRDPPTSDHTTAGPFTGAGLLAHSAANSVQGIASQGHGHAVAPSIRGLEEPLLKMDDNLLFAKGSLLDRIVEKEGGMGPGRFSVDRGKKLEGSKVRYGEGV